MSLPHGSQLPQPFEGKPFHSDSFIVSFNTEADTNGVFPYLGALVTLATDADETCKISITDDGSVFILGVCLESGILQGQLGVVVRGVVTVSVDNTTAAGDYLTFSATTDGAAHSLGSSIPSSGVRMIAIQAVTVAAGTQPVLAMLI